jgi:Ca2+-binding EF-hand superfamily protein
MQRITGFLAAAALVAFAACKDEAKKPSTTGTSANVAQGEGADRARPERNVPKGPLAKRAAPQRQAAPGMTSGGPDKQQRRDERRAERIAQFDANGDGQLDDGEREQMREARQAEREARRAEMMAEHDQNGDGQLDDAERQAMRQERVQRMFDRLDANGDGKVEPDELAARNADADSANAGRRRRGPPPIDFATADADQDGVLSSEELGAAMPERDRRGRRGGPPPEGDAATR